MQPCLEHGIGGPGISCGAGAAARPCQAGPLGYVLRNGQVSGVRQRSTPRPVVVTIMDCKDLPGRHYTGSCSYTSSFVCSCVVLCVLGECNLRFP